MGSAGSTRRVTVSANSRMVTGISLPRLKTLPTALGQFMSWITPSTMSATWREAANLLAVVMYLQWLPGQSLIDEARQDHAELPDLARADDVEESTDHHRQPAALVLREGEIFVECLARGIDPAAARGRTEDEVVLFMEWRLRILAVDLARTGQK